MGRKKGVAKKSSLGTTNIEIKKINFKNKSQLEAYEKIGKNDITFLIGPAGTSKTFLSVSYAIEGLSKKDFERVILTRPVVEASGERLGFLPGDIDDKLYPYMVPLLDFFGETFDKNTLSRNFKNGVIEFCPLAYMRGRTLKNCFIIADELQNATFDQMLMLLTRLGQGSKLVITGDPDQSDIRMGNKFREIAESLNEIKGIGLHKFYSSDIIRHPLIKEIIEVMEKIK